MREDDRTSVSETRPDRQCRMAPCAIDSQIRGVGHEHGGKIHRTCPLSDFDSRPAWLKCATWEILGQISRLLEGLQMLIQNYGLFWRRDNVFWGRPKRRGHLKGRHSKRRTQGDVDFRGQQGIYCLYDDNFSLVYVGQAGSRESQRLFSRIAQHRNDNLSDRWSKFSWFGIRKVNQDLTLRVEKAAAHPTINEVLNHIEAILIAAAEPPHNRQGGKFGENVDQYLQYIDEKNSGPNLETMVRDLWNSIERKQ